MLAQMLRACGLNLGPEEDLIPATPDNLDGHWEHREFLRINESVLNHLGGGWDDPPEHVDWNDPGLAIFRPQGEAAIKLVTGYDHWGWKDPRNSLTLPFWKELLPNLKVVVCVRNPIEVIASLRRRGLSSPSLGLRLWWTYNQSALSATAPNRRHVVLYDKLFTQPFRELARLCESLKLPASRAQIKRAAAIVKPELYHHRSALDELAAAQVSPKILQLYEQLAAEATNRASSRRRKLAATATAAQTKNGAHAFKSSGKSSAPAFKSSDGEVSFSINLKLLQQLEHRRKPTVPEGSRRPSTNELDELNAKLSQSTGNRARLEIELAELRSGIEELRASSTAAKQEHDNLRADLERMQKHWQHDTYELHSQLYRLSKQITTGQLRGTASDRELKGAAAIERFRSAVHSVADFDASVLVVSRGDDRLLWLFGRTAQHFPQAPDGQYCGYHPQASINAIAHLETLRAQGAAYLAFPQSSLWWMETYKDFWQHLEVRYQRAYAGDDAGVIYSLRSPSPWRELSRRIEQFRVRHGRLPAILDCTGRQSIGRLFSNCTVFSNDSLAPGELPYLDNSIDLVAVNADETELAAEARRVAIDSVIMVGGGSSDSAAHSSSRAGTNSCTVEIHPVDDEQSQILSAAPSVSIVIPVHNHVATTLACLTSLTETLPNGVSAEIIVVDDASTDDTPNRLHQLSLSDPRLRHIRNESNRGFLDSAQRGADAAAGDLLLFLNNDTVLLPGWLPPLLELFQRFSNAGAAGGRLLFSDGALQEAGGMVFNDASAANFGRGDHDVEALAYNLVREADYCSGAFLMTPTALFREIGGFDTRYRPAYYEDTDYCFAVRQHGYRVYYQPDSVLVHLEGLSSGTDLSKGIKQYQRINQSKFADKWQAALVRQPARPAEGDKPAWISLVLGGRTTDMTVLEGTTAERTHA